MNFPLKEQFVFPLYLSFIGVRDIVWRWLHQSKRYYKHSKNFTLVFDSVFHYTRTKVKQPLINVSHAFSQYFFGQIVFSSTYFKKNFYLYQNWFFFCIRSIFLRGCYFFKIWYMGIRILTWKSTTFETSSIYIFLVKIRLIKPPTNFFGVKGNDWY